MNTEIIQTPPHARLQREPKPLTHADILAQAYHGTKVLEQRAKAVSQEYRERIKRLRSLMNAIDLERVRDDLDISSECVSLAPELKRLVDDPTHGL
jgi:hypothetical protein